jgi:transmembrane sensor
MMSYMDDSGVVSPPEERGKLRDEAVGWVIRLQGDDLSPEDRRAFNEWQAKGPAHATMFREVLAVWDNRELRAAAAHAAFAEPPFFNGQRPLCRRWPMWGTCALDPVFQNVLGVFSIGCA